MGIMYKLMKHRNLTNELTKVKSLAKTTKSDKCHLLNTEGNNMVESNASSLVQSSEEDSSKQSMETEMDKQFTAEHILQLCKFLAEKSKRNKNVYKQQQSPKKLNKSKQPEFHFQQMDYDDNDDIDYYQNEALPLLTTGRMEQQQQQKDESQQCQQINQTILSTRLSPDINSFNISASTTTSCALQHHQQQQQTPQQNSHQQQQQQNQGKRDILLKIRHQIFERKRLREKGGYEPQAVNTSQVWRPW